jgi:hypothetical protein
MTTTHAHDRVFEPHALVEAHDGQTRLVGLVQKPGADETPAGAFAFADEIDGFTGYTNQGLKTKRVD